MFALAVHYLTGRAVCKRYGSQDDPEWPPEPARLFCALVAALHAGGNRQDERAALKWLEEQEPPSLSFSDWVERAPYVSYVPANDPSAPRKVPRRLIKRDDLAILPEYRNRNGRTFPSLTPDQPDVHFIWQTAEPTFETTQTIQRLAGRLAYLGHSSSLVSVSIAEKPPPPRITASSEGAWGTLRAVRAGYLEELEHIFDSHAAALLSTKGAAPRLPLPTSFQRYSEMNTYSEQKQFVRGIFQELHVFRLPGACPLSLTVTMRVTDALRKAAMEKSVPHPIEELSGHGADGNPSQAPHVAFVPLADVGHPHADGHLLGLAAALPRGLDGGARDNVLLAISRVERLTLGKAGAWPITAMSAGAVPKGLGIMTWSRASRRWATVTPLVLDRFPKRLYGEEAEEIVSQACVHGGFPKPTEILITPAAPFVGVPLSRDFPPLVNPGKPKRFHTHVILCFEAPVRGPMLLGAGRYKGYGLCRPLGEE